jgi:hypothetical protein
MLNTPEAPAGKPAAIIDLRDMQNLGTKVLADKPTIDEIVRRCSNPKVEPLETEVYGYVMQRTIAFASQVWGQTQSSQRPFVGAPG